MTKKSKLFLSAIAALLVALAVWAYGSAAEPMSGSVVVKKVEKTTSDNSASYISDTGYNDYEEEEDEEEDDEYEEEL